MPFIKNSSIDNKIEIIQYFFLALFTYIKFILFSDMF